MSRSPRPGLAKTHGAQLLTERPTLLWRSSDHHWGELFASADVMSEGETREEGNLVTYYGTTSLFVRRDSIARVTGLDDLQRVVALAAVDLHVRLRALRIACLEARLRAGGPIRRVHAALGVELRASGVLVSVEIEAPLEKGCAASAARSATRRGKVSRAR